MEEITGKHDEKEEEQRGRGERREKVYKMEGTQALTKDAMLLPFHFIFIV